MKRQTIILDGELPAINEIIATTKSHWSKYSRVKKANTNIVAAEALKQKLNPIINRADIVFFHYRKNKRKDPDNVAGGAAKIILDGLVKSGVLKNDTMEFVNTLVHCFEICKKNPRIEVILYEDS